MRVRVSVSIIVVYVCCGIPSPNLVSNFEKSIGIVYNNLTTMNNANVQKEMNAMMMDNVNLYEGNQQKSASLDDMAQLSNNCVQYINALEEAYIKAKTRPNEITKKLFMKSYDTVKNMIDGMACDARFDKMVLRFNEVMNVGYLMSEEEKEKFMRDVMNPMMDAKTRMAKYAALYQELTSEVERDALARRNRAAKVVTDLSGEVPSWDPIRTAPSPPTTAVAVGGKGKGKKSVTHKCWVVYQGQKRKVAKNSKGVKTITWQGKTVALGDIRGQYKYVEEPPQKGGCGCAQINA
jgi:hypothetical protein